MEVTSCAHIGDRDGSDVSFRLQAPPRNLVGVRFMFNALFGATSPKGALVFSGLEKAELPARGAPTGLWAMRHRLGGVAGEDVAQQDGLVDVVCRDLEDHVLNLGQDPIGADPGASWDDHPRICRAVSAPQEQRDSSTLLGFRCVSEIDG